MNSMSRPYDNDDSTCGCKKETAADNVILKCKLGSSVSIPAVSDDPDLPDINRFASITVNTKHFCDPCIKFEFASNLVSVLVAEEGDPVVTSSVTVTFQLYKQCRGTAREPLGSSWVYPLSNPSDAELDTSDIIKFIICDCDCDSDCDSDTCCSYYVEASTTAVGTAAITFNNPTLSALVVEKTRC